MHGELPEGQAGLRACLEALGMCQPGAEVAILIRDSSGRIVGTNTAAEEILGVPEAQMRARDGRDPRWAFVDEWGRLLAPAEMPSIRVLESGRGLRDVVLAVQTPSEDRMGRQRWVSISAEPLFHEGEQRPYGVVSASTVITGSRAVALEAIHTHRLYRMLADNSADIVVLLTVTGSTVWASPSTRTVLGIDPQDLVGVGMLELVHPDDQVATAESLQDLLADDASPPTVRRVRHRDGHWVWLEATKKVVREPDGSPQHVVACMRDVSERVVAQHAREVAERRFETAMRHAPIGMVMAGPTGELLEVNDALADLLGYTREELIGLHVRAILPPEDREGAADTYFRLVRGESVALQADQRYLRHDGGIVWGRRTITLVRDDEERPLYFLVQIQDITERKQVQSQLAQLAMTDPLTGLPNRLVLLDRLSHALAIARRDGTRVSVLFLDLDLFKAVNDAYGHAAGDAVLAEVAARLVATVRDEDTALRLGGDEFVVVCENVRDTSLVEHLAERITTALGQPYEVDGHVITISVSIGVSVGDSSSPDDLLRQADESMYRAKRSGHGRVSVYEDAAQADAMDRLSLELELRQAISAGQLELYYQRVVTLADGTTWGHEALLRWHHPSHGLLLPDRFLPVAEHSRLIAEIGNWVLDRACRDAQTWPEEWTVAVNVSPRHLARSDFPAVVREALTSSGLAPGRLCLEITESSALHTSASTIKSTGSLLDLGVSLSLDDFGTGQSSIATLHQLRIDAIKIDRSFVADLPHSTTSASLVDGLIHLGRGMGLDVVAEGVETEEQASWLIAHGCPRGQGYLYGRPEPLAPVG